MPLQDSTNTQMRNPGRDVKDVLERRSRDRGEGLSTLTPRVNDSSALDRVLRESARQSPERQLLRRRLDGLGLRENEVDGDGNCQFRAIADQLYGSSDRYAEVRANIVEHIRSNSSRYSAFVPESYDAYIENMGRDGTWGDHVTLHAASNVYDLEIRVYTSYDGNWEQVIRPTNNGNIRRAIQLSFYAELHYNSVHPITNGCSKCPKSAGPERCQYCSPENFCCVPEHGNSSSVMTDKVMCPKCSPNNFCRDPKHGNSEDNPAHKSSCTICSHGYFNNVSNEQVTGREGGSRGNHQNKQEEQIMEPRHKKDTDLVTIYILKCKEKKWYVGKTSKYGATKRIVQHFANNGGSNWTRRYKPIKVHVVKKNQNSRDEDKWTKVYMDRYGVENVRGGAYCKLELNEDQKRALDIESAGSNDLCYHCKKKGHFMAQCKEKYEEEEEEEEYEYFCEMCEECGEEFDEEEKFKRHQRTCNPAVNFNPLVSTMNYEPPETRLHIIGQRLCEQCGITDISNKPDSHARCYKCHSGENDYMLQGGGRRTMHNSSRHNSEGARRCLCGEDISSRPANHTQCLTCYRRSQNIYENESEEYERECRSCGGDISNRPLNFTQCLDCWRDERGGRGGRGGRASRRGRGG